MIILGLLNFILKEWCTISRGAEPHAQKANDEEVLKKVAHTNGWKWVERSETHFQPFVYTTYIYAETLVNACDIQVNIWWVCGEILAKRAKTQEPHKQP